MNVGELKRALEELLEDGDYTEESEVRLVHQSNYPLQEHLRGVTTTKAIAEHRVYEAPDFYDEKPEDPDYSDQEEVEAQRREMGDAVYVVAGGQVYETPYGPREAFEVC